MTKRNGKYFHVQVDSFYFISVECLNGIFNIGILN